MPSVDCDGNYVQNTADYETNAGILHFIMLSIRLEISLLELLICLFHKFLYRHW